MGERFQTYVNYGPNGDHLFALHLQWCWGCFSVIRAHQLISFLDTSRQTTFNAFGLGERSHVGGAGYDGRREDLYLLRALTEINILTASIVEGHDLMQEANQNDLFRHQSGEPFPDSVTINPLAQDTNNGFLIIKAETDGVRYGFCLDDEKLAPISAREYLNEYASHSVHIKQEDPTAWKKILDMVMDLDKVPLLSKKELAQIFDRSYSKEANIQGYHPPAREQKRKVGLDHVVHSSEERQNANVHPKPESSHSRDPTPEREVYKNKHQSLEGVFVMSINVVVLSGNLTRDAELRKTAGGLSILTFGMAFNERRRVKDSEEWEDVANFADCTLFGNRAEGIEPYMKKGAKVATNGHLRWSQWENDEGQKRSKLEVIVDELEFLGPRKDAEEE